MKKNKRVNYKKKGIKYIVLRDTLAFVVGTFYLAKELVVYSIKTIVRALIGATYLLRHIVKFIDNLVAKMFMKLPRLLKVLSIYILVVGCCMNFVSAKVVSELRNDVVKLSNKEQVVQINFTPNETATQILTDFEDDTKDKTAKVCSNEIACKIYNSAVNKGLTHEQALIVVSISRHETGNWTSKAFINKNNLGGVMCSSGLRTYSSLDDGIDAFTTLLTNRYFGKGLTTIEAIGNVYCPVGATNDPTGVNQYWIPRVTQYYNEYANE